MLWERFTIIRFFLILVQLIGLFGFGIGSSCLVIMSCYLFKHERLCIVSIDSPDSSIIFTVVMNDRIGVGLLLIWLAQLAMQLAQILLGCCESQATAQFVSRSQSLLLACDGLFGGGMGWMGPRGTQVLFIAICYFFLIYCQ